MDTAACIHVPVASRQLRRPFGPLKGSPHIYNKLNTLTAKTSAKKTRSVRVKGFIVVVCMCITESHVSTLFQLQFHISITYPKKRMSSEYPSLIITVQLT